MLKFTEYILDEAKVSLEVTYIKGVPMPDELKVCRTVYNINQTMDWCIPIIYLVELGHSFKEKYEIWYTYKYSFYYMFIAWEDDENCMNKDKKSLSWKEKDNSN